MIRQSMGGASLLRVLVASALLALTSCGGGSRVKGGEFGAPPVRSVTFPPHHLDGDVHVEASLSADRKRVFDWDPVDKDVLPVKLLIGLRQTRQESAHIRLDPDTMDLRLYLPDGTVLEAMHPDVVAEKASGRERKQRVKASALNMSLLSEWDTIVDDPSYVYFNLASLKDADVSGRLLTHGDDEEVTVNLTKALLVFNLLIEARTKPFYVGIELK